MDAVSILTNLQNTYEQRFNCPICLCPNMRMVYGSCQHRICQDCLYDAENIIRPSLHRCPSCQKEGSFPEQRPDIPDDNIELQKCLGVRVCENGCDMELWEWEIEEHSKACPNRIGSFPTRSRRKRSIVKKDSGDKKKSMSCRSIPRVTRNRSRLASTPLQLRSRTATHRLSTSNYDDS